MQQLQGTLQTWLDKNLSWNFLDKKLKINKQSEASNVN